MLRREEQHRSIAGPFVFGRSLLWLALIGDSLIVYDEGFASSSFPSREAEM